MRSMTGFGRAEIESDGRKVTIEIKTVNHRFLDINIRITRALGFAEEIIRKTIKGKLCRGRVDVFVNYSSSGEDAKTAKADSGLINSYLIAARSAGRTAGVEDDIKLSHVIRIPDAILIEEATEDEAQQVVLVDSALKAALEDLTDMRAREGKELEENIFDYLDILVNITSEIDSRKSFVVKEYADKLKLRIAELTQDCEVDETRFNTEIAYIADKADITEEIVRLNTHIKQFRNAVSKDTAIGRKLDFIVQEMNRELNTIGSKSSDIDVTNAVIEGKSTVEKIREQVQNIE